MRINVRTIPIGHYHGLVTCRQPGGQFLCHPALVTDQNPYPRGLGHLSRTLRHDHALVQLLERKGVVHSQHLDPLETGIAQRPTPDVGGGQGVVGAVVVGKPPPAVKLAEGEVHPTQTAQVLERHQLTGRCQKIPTVPERFLEKTGGVQDVGSDQQVIAVRIEALGNGVFLDVQRQIPDATVSVSEPLLRLGEESGGNVGVGVIEPSGGEFR